MAADEVKPKPENGLARKAAECAGCPYNTNQPVTLDGASSSSSQPTTFPYSDKIVLLTNPSHCSKEITATKHEKVTLQGE